jgi:hypothetical protein
MTGRVYGAAGGTGRVLACVRGPPRQPRCARRRRHRGGPTTRRPSRGDARRRRPPLQQLSASHRSDIYIESGTPRGCVTRSAAVRSTPRHWPRQASSTKRRPYRSTVEKSPDAPKVMTATCGGRVPGSRAIAPWGSNGEMRPPTRQVRPTSGIPVAAHRHRPIVDDWGTSMP